MELDKSKYAAAYQSEIERQFTAAVRQKFLPKAGLLPEAAFRTL